MPAVTYMPMDVIDPATGLPTVEFRGMQMTVVERGTETPVELTDVNGLAMANPITIGTVLAKTPAFVIADLTEVDLLSPGGFRTVLRSDEGLLVAAQAAAAAAEVSAQGVTEQVGQAEYAAYLANNYAQNAAVSAANAEATVVGGTPVDVETILPDIVAELAAPVVAVETYGATGNGTTDDTAAINDALAAAPAGSVVTLKPGRTYRVSGLLLENKADLTFAGNGGTLLLAATGARHGLDLFGTCERVTIRGHRIVGSGVSADQHVGIRLRWGGTYRDVRILDNNITGTTQGIPIGSELGGLGGLVDGVLIQGNSVRNTVGTDSGFGYGISNSSYQSTPCNVRIVGNSIDGAQRHAIYQASGDNVTISANVVTNHRAGVAQGLVRSAITVLRSSNVTVSGNAVHGAADGCLTVAADIRPCKGVLVVGNTFGYTTNAIQPVTLGDSSPSQVIEDVSFVGNRVYIDANATRLLRFYAGKHVLIANNHLHATNTASVSVLEFSTANDTAATKDYSDRIVVSGNLIVCDGGSATHRAIRFSGLESSAAAIAIFDNTISGATSFISGANVSNPNLTVGGQPIDGLNFAGGVTPKVTPAPITKAASPGTATGTDAAVLNAVVTILRNAGLCA